MRILFITKEKLSYNEAPPSRILNIAKLLKPNHDVMIISKKSSAQIDRTGVTEISLIQNNFISNQVYKIVLIYLALRTIIKERVDFVFTREYIYVVLLFPFSRILKFRTIYDMHCFRYKELRVEKKHIKSIIVSSIEKLAHSLSDYILAISEGIIQDMPQKYRSKTILMPNGVDLSEFQSKVDKSVFARYNIPKKRIVGFVGNWMEWVDVPTVLEASMKFSDDLSLVIVGKWYKEDEIAGLQKQYPHVTFTGRIPHADALSLMRCMDICILPYKNEEVIKHLSVRKTLEYLASGRPIIMSDSNIREKSFLKEGQNMVLYKPGDADDLAFQINKLARNKKLMREMTANNVKLAGNFSWSKQMDTSGLKYIFGELGATHEVKGKITVVIKALNEEQYIKKSIKSALEALEGFDGEVILVDSKSSDKTVDIAKKFPIRIIQLKQETDRCCGIGPQIGYLYSKSEFIYILDGDMMLDKDFFKWALPYFSNPIVAGVGGNIFEKSEVNLAFQVRKKHHTVDRVRFVDQLGMGGLYRRSCIDKVGYFSNPYFFAYEEFDLGVQLSRLGFKLIRIPHKMIDHFGDETSYISTMLNRFKSRYIYGSGQYLRRSINAGHFLQTAWELRIYVFTIIWSTIGMLCFILWFSTPGAFKFYIISTSILFMLVLLIKRNVNKTLFSIISWTMQSIGLIIGFFRSAKDPKSFKPEVIVIK